MLDIQDVITKRLHDSQLEYHEMRRLIRDVSNIIGRRSYFEPANLKPALKRLGWKEDILDYRTLELICTFIENHC